MKFKDLKFFLGKPVGVQIAVPVYGIGTRTVNGKLFIEEVELENNEKLEFGVPAIVSNPQGGPAGYGVLCGHIRLIPDNEDMVMVEVPSLVDKSEDIVQVCLAVDDIKYVSLLPNPAKTTAVKQIVGPDGTAPAKVH